MLLYHQPMVVSIFPYIYLFISMYNKKSSLFTFCTLYKKKNVLLSFKLCILLHGMYEG